MGDEEKGRAEQQRTRQTTIEPPDPPANESLSMTENRILSTDAKERIKKSDKIMIAATLVIAVGTLVSAGAICFQWREMHTGGVDTTKIAQASEKSAQAARDFADTAARINGGIGDAVKKLQTQADQTMKLADISKSAQKSQRAFIFSTPVITELKRPDGSSGGVSVDVVWTNSGDTPTKDLIVSGYQSYDRNFVGDPAPLLLRASKNEGHSKPYLYRTEGHFQQAP